MFIKIVKFRETQGAAEVVLRNVYSTLVGKCFEMAVWKTEISAYCDEDKCHMTDRWPFK